MGVRGLAIAILVLAAIVATPAFSAAQDTGTTTTTAEPILTAPPAPEASSPSDAGEPPDAGKPGDEPGKPEEADRTEGTSAPPPPAPVATPRSAGGEVARASASATVSIGDNFYSPATVTIAVGDIVTWTNNGQAQHSATANNGSFDTGVFGRGSSRAQTFNRAGTFSYFCTVHGPVQSGTVRVLAASGGGEGGRGLGRLKRRRHLRGGGGRLARRRRDQHRPRRDRARGPRPRRDRPRPPQRRDRAPAPRRPRLPAASVLAGETAYSSTTTSETIPLATWGGPPCLSAMKQ